MLREEFILNVEKQVKRILASLDSSQQCGILSAKDKQLHVQQTAIDLLMDACDKGVIISTDLKKDIVKLFKGSELDIEQFMATKIIKK